MGAEAKLRAERTAFRKKLKREASLNASERTLSPRQLFKLTVGLSLAELILAGCTGEQELPQFNLQLPAYIGDGSTSLPFPIPPEYAGLYSEACPPIASFAQQGGSVTISVSPDQSQATLAIQTRDNFQGSDTLTVIIRRNKGVFQANCEPVAEAVGSTFIDTKPPSVSQASANGNNAVINVDEAVVVTNTTDGSSTSGGPGQVQVPISNVNGEAHIRVDDQRGHTTDAEVTLPTQCTLENTNVRIWDPVDQRVETNANCNGNGVVTNGSLQTNVTPGMNSIPVNAADGAQNTIIVTHGIFSNPVSTFTSPVQSGPIATLNIPLTAKNGQVTTNVTCNWVADGAPCTINGQQIPMGFTQDVVVGQAQINSAPQTAVVVTDPFGRTNTIMANSAEYNPFATIQGFFSSWKGHELDVSIVINDPTNSVRTITLSGRQHTAMSDGSIWQSIEKAIKGSSGDFTCDPKTNIQTQNTAPKTVEFVCDVPYGKRGNIDQLSAVASDVNGVQSSPIPIDIYATSNGQADRQTYPTITETVYGVSSLGGIGLTLATLAVLGVNTIARLSRENHKKEVENAKKRLGMGNILNSAEIKYLEGLVVEYKDRAIFKRALKLKRSLDKVSEHRKYADVKKRDDTIFDYTSIRILAEELAEDNYNPEQSKAMQDWQKFDGKLAQGNFSSLVHTKELLTDLVLQELNARLKEIDLTGNAIYVPQSLLADKEAMVIIKKLYMLHEDSWFWRRVNAGKSSAYSGLKNITPSHLEVLMLANAQQKGNLQQEWSATLYELFKARRPNVRFADDIIPNAKRIRISTK
jgi:hypothetical protein